MHSVHKGPPEKFPSLARPNEMLTKWLRWMDRSDEFIEFEATIENPCLRCITASTLF